MGKTIIILLFSAFAFGQTYETHNYGEHPQQEYDIYFPDEVDEDTKVVIFLHGGAWWALNRQRAYYRSFVEDLFDAGDNIVINVDYRLLVEGTETYVFPDQINDVESVINHVQTTYNLHNNSVVLSGNSAGGHLVTWYYLNQITPVEKIIPIAAPYDGSVETNGVPYFYTGIPSWIQNQFVNPDMGIEDVISYVSSSTYANPDLDDIFWVYMTGDPAHQLEAIQEDYPDIRYLIQDTWHSGWLGSNFRWDLINQIIDFIGGNETLSVSDYEQSSEDWRYYNIHGRLMKGAFEFLPRGYYIKNNGQESIKIYKK